MSLFTKELKDQHGNTNNITNVLDNNPSFSAFVPDNTTQHPESYPKNTNRLRIVNNLLLLVLLCINTYIILMPLLPQFIYSDYSSSDSRKQLEQTISKRIEDNNQNLSKDNNKTSVMNNKNSGNILTVPSMLLDEPIIEGQNSILALRQGVWRWPGGSTPDKGGNTVLAGHRFTYSNPKGTFYFLNKISVGDKIGVTWNGYTYLYKVTEVKTVKTSQTDDLRPTDYPRLTLYTCTPLWNPKDRLVVVAELQNKETQ